MKIDDCSGLHGHILKSCSRCGHQFDILKMTRLDSDQLNAIKDKEWQFGFRWKLSDWKVGEAVIVDLCPKCHADVVNLIDTNEMVDKLTVDYSSKHPDFLTKQLIIPICKCQICHKELPKKDIVNIPHYITCDIQMNPDDYFVRMSRSEKQALLDHISRYSYTKVCPQCYDGLLYEYRSNQVQRHKEATCYETPIYINGKKFPGVAKLYNLTRFDELNDSKKRLNHFLDAARYALKFKNGNYINLEERKMKNVNETKKNAFAIERNYDETDRKLFRLEDAETGDFIRLATDEEKRIYMVVNIHPIKSRLKVNDKPGVWCVCIQTQDLVELPLSEMVYVYDPDCIVLRLGRFIEDTKD